MVQPFSHIEGYIDLRFLGIPYLVSMSISVDHPLVQKVLNEAVESRGGWTQGAPTNSIEALEAFIAAIQWNQPFFYALLITYTILLIISITIRHYSILQFILLVLCFLGVLLSESLNEWLSMDDHWSSTLQLSNNYFDNGGIFISVVWSLPLAIIAFINLVRTTAQPHNTRPTWHFLFQLCFAC